MKDGIMDKLSDYISELKSEGLVCQLIGAEEQALDSMHCDICRVKYLTELAMTSAFDILDMYKKRVESRGNH